MSTPPTLPSRYSILASRFYSLQLLHLDILELDIHGETLVELESQHAFFQRLGAVIKHFSRRVAVDLVEDVVALDRQHHVIPDANFDGFLELLVALFELGGLGLLRI